MLAKIGFHELLIHATHGVWPEEKLTGNNFSVDMQIAVDLPDTDVPLTLAKTIDYAKLVELSRTHFSVHHELLENLAINIIREVQLTWPIILGCHITIRKLDPLINATTKDTFVELATGYFMQ